MTEGGSHGFSLESHFGSGNNDARPTVIAAGVIAATPLL